MKNQFQMNPVDYLHEKLYLFVHPDYTNGVVLANDETEARVKVATYLADRFLDKGATGPEREAAIDHLIYYRENLMVWQALRSGSYTAEHPDVFDMY